ncbi:MAG: hypothetical protein K9G62_04655 [Alphaproteobacteria bacterium]|nr:hypothetical protein [Alphaproteobacteria bacterium]
MRTWPPKERQKQADPIRRMKPWEKSTKAGKRRARMNALEVRRERSERKC